MLYPFHFSYEICCVNELLRRSPSRQYHSSIFSGSLEESKHFIDSHQSDCCRQVYLFKYQQIRLFLKARFCEFKPFSCKNPILIAWILKVNPILPSELMYFILRLEPFHYLVFTYPVASLHELHYDYLAAMAYRAKSQ